MPEQYKTKKGQDPVRLASTSGHVIIIGGDWREVPPALELEASRAGLLSKTIFNMALEEAKAELAGDAEEVVRPGPAIKADEPDVDALIKTEAAGVTTEGAAQKSINIMKAISEVLTLSEAGKEKTPGGKKLVNSGNGRPLVDAVSELAGFKVSVVDIEEALK